MYAPQTGQQYATTGPMQPYAYAPQQALARADGDALVVPNGAALPPVCVKCGTRHGLGHRSTKLTFVPAWARFFGPLMQLIARKTSTFELPVCSVCNSRWRRGNVFVWLSWLPTLLLLGVCAGVAAVDSDGTATFAVGALALVVFPVLWIIAMVMRRGARVGVRRIDKTHSWLLRVHPEAMRAACGG
jgi:hypothetical protein